MGEGEGGGEHSAEEEKRDWNIGILEYWNNAKEEEIGVMEYWNIGEKRKNRNQIRFLFSSPFFQLPIIPLFQYSSLSVTHHSSIPVS
jgi:hypothetical protein